MLNIIHFYILHIRRDYNCYSANTTENLLQHNGIQRLLKIIQLIFKKAFIKNLK